MEQKKKSASAVFIDILLVISAVLCAIAFAVYYSGLLKHGAVLWVGIVGFMIVYHFSLRLLEGVITSKLKINRHSFWFSEKPFEKKLYRLLLVRKWRDRVLTYDPDAFSRTKHSWDEIADAMTKAELDHWINEAISLTSILFSLLWGNAWIFIISAVCAMLFDAQFIVLQRFNRPKVEKIVKGTKKRREYSSAV